MANAGTIVDEVFEFQQNNDIKVEEEIKEEVDKPNDSSISSD